VNDLICVVVLVAPNTIRGINDKIKPNQNQNQNAKKG
jgi:hypothetical protein